VWIKQNTEMVGSFNSNVSGFGDCFQHISHNIQGKQQVLVSKKSIGGSQDENIAGDITIIPGKILIANIVDFVPDMGGIDS
jgi:hypothetical protein